MRWKPNVTVAAVIERNRKFLLVEEHDAGRVVYNQPAGHLERGETLLQAVRREVLEETAWEFEPQSVVGVYLHPHEQHGLSYLRFCFAGHCRRRHPGRALDEGIIRAVWFTREELCAARHNTRSRMVLQCIDDYLAGKRFTLDVLTEYIAESRASS